MDFQYETGGKPYVLSLDSEDRSLRPRDAADEYLLSLPETGNAEKILIIGDRCGALSVPLAERCIALINDSLGEQKLCTENIKKNGCPPLPALNSLEEIPGKADLILIKIPKSLEAFRWILQRLQGSLKQDCPVRAAGMSRYLPGTFFELFREFFPEGEYSRIEKKARYYSGFLKAGQKDKNILPVPSESFSYREMEFFAYPAVFSRGKLDLGSRLLLDWLFEKGRPWMPAPSLIADPGCGCGVLGLSALKIWEEAELIATDDNAQAVASTIENGLCLNLVSRVKAKQDHILASVQNESVDMVIVNPPFHKGHTVSMETGLAFLKDSSRVLKKGGYLIAVTNKHLGYDNLLNSLFQSAKAVKENKSYKVYLCQK